MKHTINSILARHFMILKARAQHKVNNVT